MTLTATVATKLNKYASGVVAVIVNAYGIVFVGFVMLLFGTKNFADVIGNEHR